MVPDFHKFKSDKNPSIGVGGGGSKVPSLAQKLPVTVNSLIINQHKVGTKNRYKHFLYHENRKEQGVGDMCKSTFKVVASIVKS